MKIFLFDQKTRFNFHLNELKSSKVLVYNKLQLKEKKSSIEIETTKKIEEIDLKVLFEYSIFPSNILTFKSQWNHENRAMQKGDTIVQQIFLPPIKRFSQKIVVGVRINEIIHEDDKAGFSYETLEGHVEKGISTFIIEQNEGKLYFTIHTFSSPGNFLTKLLGPIFSQPYQRFCTKAALKNVKNQLEKQ
jgi:hypothetical protein